MASNGRRVCLVWERGRMLWKGLSIENHSSLSPGHQTRLHSLSLPSPGSVCRSNHLVTGNALKEGPSSAHWPFSSCLSSTLVPKGPFYDVTTATSYPCATTVRDSRLLFLFLPSTCGDPPDQPPPADVIGLLPCGL